ncbi:hypothetical protein Hypma_009603 [Hypsizygus marmoreus]|uniref:Zn(2)-C6 fungal-type domain-containing protein n=1 Tax=Hypsizygus marmoreus TaxID=39966 RepID=A0A369JPJ3_HYPMA|nr:hypothetical protein Hypma_009603 [Hypsizygus marmoreus]
MFLLLKPQRGVEDLLSSSCLTQIDREGVCGTNFVTNAPCPRTTSLHTAPHPQPSRIHPLIMSSTGGSSVGNMPPRHGKKLADVLEEAFKTNSKALDETEENKSEAGAPPPPPRSTAPPQDSKKETEKQPQIKELKGYTMSSVYPPQPCERCVRSKKTCKGIAGARCEHCKVLHQKCSNSTGPPRGRHAVAAAAAHQGSSPLSEDGQPGPSAAPRPKRKAAPKAKLTESKEDDYSEEDELEDYGPAPKQPPRKKRKVGSDARTRALKEIGELEGAIKKLQTTFSKDLAKLHQLASSLTSRIQDME